MPHLNQNPHLQICPDFRAPPFAVTRQHAVTQGAANEEDAAQQLEGSWLAWIEAQ
jgi:hypothetical protein